MMADMVCSGEAVESCSQVRERLELEVTLNRVRVFFITGWQGMRLTVIESHE